MNKGCITSSPEVMLSLHGVGKSVVVECSNAADSHLFYMRRSFSANPKQEIEAACNGVRMEFGVAPDLYSMNLWIKVGPEHLGHSWVNMRAANGCWISY